LNTSSVTKQGNTFNGGGQLVKLDAASKMTANYGAGNVTGTVLPSGTLIITTATCPSGFNEFTGAGGFYLVGAPAGGTVGGTVGAAMTNLNDATHSHSITRTTGNNFSTLGAATAVTSVTTPTGTESRSNIAPYYQVRLCSVP
jgi:hypothetical protein